MQTGLINLSFYRFFEAGGEDALYASKSELFVLCRRLGLKGTILLAHEGVNVMISGTRAAMDEFKAYAREHLHGGDDVFKEAPDLENSFHRMLIKIKKEIIAVGDPTLKPHEKTAKRVKANELASWLDENKPIVLLDTRNEYEVEVGTFKGAQTFKLDHSRSFAKKTAENLEQLKGKTVVTFCTGGIRCEKASAVLLNLGLTDVYQLDGGILRYFEETGGKHFDGQCFVFDWREAIDGNLQPKARSEDPAKEFGRHKKQKT